MRHIDTQNNLINILRQHEKMGEYVGDNVDPIIKNFISSQMWENTIAWTLHPVKVELIKNICNGTN